MFLGIKMAKTKKTKKISSFSNERLDSPTLIITLLLLSIGLIMLLSASAPKSFSENGNSYEYIIKQGGISILGLGIMFVISMIDYKIYKKINWIIKTIY